MFPYYVYSLPTGSAPAPTTHVTITLEEYKESIMTKTHERNLKRRVRELEAELAAYKAAHGEIAASIREPEVRTENTGNEEITGIFAG